jgi:arsenate reductase
MKILILCTGNSCRSQMAHGFLQSFDKRMQVFSAGTKPAENINSMAVDVMKRAGVDLSDHTPKHVDSFINDSWDYVITVCDQANEACPVFPGKVRHRLHMGFDDPSAATGSYIEILNEFYRVRNES